jgi:hypothetical protein
MIICMSAINGDKSRHSINRKRAIARRVKVRKLLEAQSAKSSNAPVATTTSRAKATPR